MDRRVFSIRRNLYNSLVLTCFLFLLLSRAHSNEAFVPSYFYAQHPVVVGEANNEYRHLEFLSTYNSSYHLALDYNIITIAGGSDDFGEPFNAMANGKIVWQRNETARSPAGQDSFGDIFYMEHKSPGGMSLLTGCFHMQSFSHLGGEPFITGDLIPVGQHIGTIGDADGYYTNAAHLHCEGLLERKIPSTHTESGLAVTHNPYVASLDDKKIESYFDLSTWIDRGWINNTPKLKNGWNRIRRHIYNYPDILTDSYSDQYFFERNIYVEGRHTNDGRAVYYSLKDASFHGWISPLIYEWDLLANSWRVFDMGNLAPDDVPTKDFWVYVYKLDDELTLAKRTGLEWKKFNFADQVQTISAVNVRSAPAGPVMDSANSYETGFVIGGPVRAELNGHIYDWFHVGFSVNKFGWVAQEYLNFFEHFPTESLVGSPPTPVQSTSENQSLFSNLFQLASLTEAQIVELVGCDLCGGNQNGMTANDVPAPFAVKEPTVTCQNDSPEVRIEWESSFGSATYEVFRDLVLVQENNSTGIYLDSSSLIAGSQYQYVIKAKNTLGQRNASNTPLITVPLDVCGPPGSTPYDGPFPSVETAGAAAISLQGVTFHGLINPNTLNVSSYFEYGTYGNYDISTNPVPVGIGTNTINYDWSVTGLSCGTTYNYRAIASFSEGEVKGDSRLFSTPSCDSEALSNLAAQYDNLNEHILLIWQEPLIESSSTVVIPELKIVSDPRPGVTIGEWEARPAQSIGVEHWADIWIAPQPGATYCYRARTLNNAAPVGMGYSDYSNEACLTIPGTYVPIADFPSFAEASPLPDTGIRVSWESGNGAAVIERRKGSEPFSTVTNISFEQTPRYWVDNDVESGMTYCYRFSQSGQSSIEFCSPYFTQADLTAPTMLSLRRVDSNTVNLSWTVDHPTTGYFRYYYLYPGDGWLQFGTTGQSGNEIITADSFGFSDSDACYRVEQLVNGAISPLSDMMCLPAGEENFPDNSEITIPIWAPSMYGLLFSSLAIVSWRRYDQIQKYGD